MITDIEIATNCRMKPIEKLVKNLNINSDEFELYGKYKAKLNLNLLKRLKDKKTGKLILVTAISPTPFGEGKTTTTIGIGQSMNLLGENAISTIREPSLGPVMGIKGGAAGGGYAQVVPMEDINLHFTGDMHAISAANNLLSAVIDNHIHHGNKLLIDPVRVVWKRAIDINDRTLRNIVVGLGGKTNGVTREDSFVITAASEIMAILCLSSDLMDLKKRLGNIIVAYSYNGSPVYAKDLKAEGALSLLLKDTIKPNLVQTLENTPVLVHGGPFANIAHGCNSIIATKMALKLSDYVITEAGFGADLGAEKFFNIKCRYAGLKPDAVVLVATIRSLKYNGKVKKSDLYIENLDAINQGFENMKKHIENLNLFKIPVVVAVNLFSSDTPDEINLLKNKCSGLNVPVSFSEVYTKGGKGGIDLAEKIIHTIKSSPSRFKPLYDLNQPIKKKVETICKKIYGAKGVIFSHSAQKSISKIEEMGMNKLPICMAKTQYSLSDNPLLLGRPDNFNITVREINLNAGAGFIVAITGEIMTMPGLPKSPASERIDISAKGEISGLF